MDSSDARMRTKTVTQRSALKNSLTSQNYLSRLTSQQSSRKSTLLPPTHQFNPWNFLQARRQSQLNTLFNIRKQKLDEITRANYAIYEKINTQETHYRKKFNHLKQHHFKAPHSKFYTIEQSCLENSQSRKVLGPICNFRPLKTPFTETKAYQYGLDENKELKSTSAAKLNAKKSKMLKKQDESLPVLFQFY